MNKYLEKQVKYRIKKADLDKKFKSGNILRWDVTMPWKKASEWKRNLNTRKGITGITGNNSIYTSFRALENEMYVRKAQETAQLVSYFRHKQKGLFPMSAWVEKTLWWHMSYKYCGDGNRQIRGAQTKQPHWISKSQVTEKILFQTACK